MGGWACNMVWPDRREMGGSPRVLRYPLLMLLRRGLFGALRGLKAVYFPEASTMTMKSIITLANSIIGVSILAMPYCFKQCGIVLATLMVICSGLIVKLSCHILLKSAILARRRNYELLAFQTYGSLGKLCVEVCMIGFLMGTCIAFFVVMGDLAPPVVAKITGTASTANLRLVILIALGIFVTFPLSLLRNVESLSGLCTVSIGFYCFVLSHIVIASWPSLMHGSWTHLVNLWRPAGIFQCLPIFCTALSCQPQIFEIYDALPDPSLATMNDIVKGAVNLCSGCYICVGIFGYIAFAAVEVGGNVLTAFSSSVIVESIKIGFVLSVAVSFPLVIFPCRSSLHSLIYRKGSNPNDSMVSNYIPPDRFNLMTAIILGITLTMGIMIPDIEFVLGLVGSTIGCVICTIFPALIFMKLTTKNTTERIAAQFCFVVGICILVLGTYVNLQEANKAPDIETKLAHQEEILNNIVSQPPLPKPANASGGDEVEADKVKIDKPSIQVKDENLGPKRIEPKEPEAPREDYADKPKAESEVKSVRSNNVTKDSTMKALPALETLKQELKVNKTLEAVKDVEEKIKWHDQQEKADKLIEELEKQKEEQKEILEEQKEVLKQMKEQMLPAMEGAPNVPRQDQAVNSNQEPEKSGQNQAPNGGQFHQEVLNNVNVPKNGLNIPLKNVEVNQQPNVPINEGQPSDHNKRVFNQVNVQLDQLQKEVPSKEEQNVPPNQDPGSHQKNSRIGDRPVVQENVPLNQGQVLANQDQNWPQNPSLGQLRVEKSNKPLVQESVNLNQGRIPVNQEQMPSQNFVRENQAHIEQQQPNDQNHQPLNQPNALPNIPVALNNQGDSEWEGHPKEADLSNHEHPSNGVIGNAPSDLNSKLRAPIEAGRPLRRSNKKLGGQNGGDSSSNQKAVNDKLPNVRSKFSPSSDLAKDVPSDQVVPVEGVARDLKEIRAET
ncbi:putative sodium-coupled neutral amino acid transporter 10 isoform X2 [Tigriopus californicus]|uniref:putative sodium-coupled neutral amino acid transporter 10 isoform X2 n=1 Tax=Tigriopus californicus TaxID=6832 RepID=UPI0027D9CF08|nr:putative sodium-coupled neutral amino acid transporter 10 isoform X2 [Tigriopus californicus]|eukprot:TCALIF_08902-PA protein Name:"Similar to slc38a10 Putative sodium-coupled neutral amino acid transporter 10 (Xenopus laevis)" AED:0.05 eAED:0.05 QI:506/1/1/1/0.83/1/7/708/949